MSWMKEVFGVEKPIIAMCHLRALPGDPDYDPDKGMPWVIEMAAADLQALQRGGVDAVMITVPYGVNVLWDPMASIELAVATGASFVREIFTGAYASDFGIWDTNCGAVVRRQHTLGGGAIRKLYNIIPEAASYLADRKIADIARSTVFNGKPDALCVSGLIAGASTSAATLKIVKEAVPDTIVLANTGVCPENVEEQLSIADGAVVGTTFKRDGHTWNEVDEKRVRALMDKVNSLRS
jgi:membrane complex biogenesis BtpA family protein